MVNPPRGTTQPPKPDTSGGQMPILYGTRISFIKLLLLYCPGGPRTTDPHKGLSYAEKDNLLI